MRYVLTILAAAAFVGVCWLISDSVNGDTRILAGPVLLLRTWGAEDHAIGAGLMLILLPCIFAVGIRTNAVTVILSILACLCWVGFGLLVEGIASV